MSKNKNNIQIKDFRFTVRVQKYIANHAAIGCQLLAKASLEINFGVQF